MFAIFRKSARSELLYPWVNFRNLRLYRALHVLNCGHNDACAEIIWPIAQHVLATVHTLTNVLAIKCFHKITKPTAFLLMMGTCLFTIFERSALKGAANVYEVSSKFKNHVGRQGMKRGRVIGRSIRCLRIQVGSAYYFKMSTFNTFMQTVVEWTINVMLTFF